jgi:hypothetical protein
MLLFQLPASVYSYLFRQLGESQFLQVLAAFRSSLP